MLVRFTSQYAGYNLVVLNENVLWNPDGQKQVIPSADGRRSGPMIYVDFGESSTFGDEVQFSDLDGEKSSAPEIRTGIYDTDEAAKAHNWTEYEKAEVERRLLELCENKPGGHPPGLRPVGFGDVKVYEPPVLTPPWPKYEEAPAEKVAAMADSLGLVGEAWVYEQRRPEPRESVLEALRALVEKEQAAEDLTVVEA